MAQGTNPMNNITRPDISNPKGKNALAFARSDMLPMRNFDNPYAIPTAESAIPTSACENPC